MSLSFFVFLCKNNDNMHTAREFEILFRLISSSAITKEEAFTLYEAVIDTEKYRDEHSSNLLDPIKYVPRTDYWTSVGTETSDLDRESPFDHKPISWGLTAVPASNITGLSYTTSTSLDSAQNESTLRDSFESSATCEAATGFKVCKTSGEITDGCSLTLEK